MGKEENILGTEKVGKLIKKFSIPCIISMVVNSLYNIVDQIFVGQGVGYLGNGATNIIFPLTVVAMSIALMIGDGTSAFLNLKISEKKEQWEAVSINPIEKIQSKKAKLILIIIKNIIILITI